MTLEPEQKAPSNDEDIGSPMFQANNDGKNTNNNTITKSKQKAKAKAKAKPKSKKKNSNTFLNKINNFLSPKKAAQHDHNNNNPDTNSSKTNSKKVDNEINAHLNKQGTKEVNLLLLGAGGSGKSTILKQMEKLYNGDIKFMQNSLANIQCNLLRDIYDLCQYNIILSAQPNLITPPLQRYRRQQQHKNSNHTAAGGLAPHTNTNTNTNSSRLSPIELSDQKEPYLRTNTENKYMLSSPELQECAFRISNWSVIDVQKSDGYTMEVAGDIARLWADPGMRNTWRNRRRSHIMDNTPYFFDKCLHFCTQLAPAHRQTPTQSPRNLSHPKKHHHHHNSNNQELVSFEDYVRLRDQTTGVNVQSFESHTRFGEYTFRVTDVGGQRSERRKWMAVFDNINAVVFIVNVAGYDQVLFEDNSKNCLDESFDLFVSTSSHAAFVSTDWIIFFNKSDLFEVKIRTVPFTVYNEHFPEKDAHNAMKVRQFIQQEFRAKKKQPPSSSAASATASAKAKQPRASATMYFHDTCATHEFEVAAILARVQIDIIKSRMKKMGYLM